MKGGSLVLSLVLVSLLIISGCSPQMGSSKNKDCDLSSFSFEDLKNEDKILSFCPNLSEDSGKDWECTCAEDGDCLMGDLNLDCRFNINDITQYLQMQAVYEAGNLDDYDISIFYLADLNFDGFMDDFYSWDIDIGQPLYELCQDHPFSDFKILVCDIGLDRSVSLTQKEANFRANAFCGNNICDGYESCASCTQDCGGCCGDGICNYLETSITCELDCSTCGNNVLDEGEVCDTIDGLASCRREEFCSDDCTYCYDY